MLETSELIFRGDFRLVIPFKDIRDLEAADGVLAVRFSGGEARFELGVLAPKWAEKIRNPRGRLAKLGLKPGACVMVVGLLDSDFQDDLAEMEAVVVDAAAGASADLIFFGASSPADLDCLPEMSKRIRESGAVWVVAPKGKGSPLKDTEIMIAARSAGLVDTKVVSFSDSQTALKLVIPVAERERAKGADARK